MIITIDGRVHYPITSLPRMLGYSDSTIRAYVRALDIRATCTIGKARMLAEHDVERLRSALSKDVGSIE